MLWQETVSRNTFRIVPAPDAEETCRRVGGLSRLLAPVLAALAERRGVRPCAAPQATAFEGGAAADWATGGSAGGEAPADALHFALRHEATVLGALEAQDAWMWGAAPGMQLPPTPPARVVSRTPQWARAALEALPSRLASDQQVDAAFARVPPALRARLLSFQRDGVRFGLRRHGRCLIADDMGVGKTLQAIAVAAAYRHEGAILVAVPASLRLMWAEEIERWIPQLRPSDIHIIFGSQDRISGLPRQPRVVITSYTMMGRLKEETAATKWAVAVVDESHALRTGSVGRGENATVAAVERVLRQIPRVVMLSGTPALSRPFDLFIQAEVLWPGLLSNNKTVFANAYCERRLVQNGRYRRGMHYEMRGGQRLPELHALLRECIMIRRRKEEVLAELPPKRRQVVRLVCPAAEGMVTQEDAVVLAMERYDPDAEPNWSQEQRAAEAAAAAAMQEGAQGGAPHSQQSQQSQRRAQSQQRAHFRRQGAFWERLGEAKVDAVGEWLSGILEGSDPSYKMLVFAHHHKVMDRLQSGPIERARVGFVRIDGTVDPVERQEFVRRFKHDPSVRVAILSIKAASVGLDFSMASAVVFAELPDEAALLQQAEDRAHRRGVQSSVLVHILVARGSAEEMRWQRLAQSMDMLQVVRSGEGALEKGAASIRIDHVVDHAEGAGADAAREALAGAQEVLDEARVAAGGDDALGGVPPSVPPGAPPGAPPSLTASLQPSLPPSSPPEWPEEEVVLTQAVRADDDGAWGSGAADSAEGAASDVWAEVSGHTGRLHLHGAADGTRPLHVNLLPQEALVDEPDGQDAAADAAREGALAALPPTLAASAAARAAVREVAREWQQLRAYDRRRLVGRVVQAPLTAALAVVDAEERATAAAARGNGVGTPTGGPRGGGSKRRHAGLDHTAAELPPGAAARIVRFMDRGGGGAGVAREVEQPFSAAGQRLCVLCMHPYELPHARGADDRLGCRGDLFCSAECQKREREMSCAKGLRDELRQLERGVCVLCGLDCVNLVRRLAAVHAPERGAARTEALAKRRALATRLAPAFASLRRPFDRLLASPLEGHAWHADHIVPVFRGGGLCSVGNMRTLCVPCHAAVTKEQAKERAEARRRARPKGQRRIDTVLASLSPTPPSRRTSGAAKAGMAASDGAADDGVEVIELSSDSEDEDFQASGRRKRQRL